MAITPYEFWYSGQQTRFLGQLVRGFSGFSYQTGSVAGAPPQTVMVPCRIATTSRMVANLMSNLSENTLLAVPLISIYQTGLRGRREDLQNTDFVDYRQVIERNILPDGSYGTGRGNAYSVDRIMPLPFTMDIQVDIWTSNMQQKYMLIEQILPVIYPQFEIQNSDNALDWTAVTIALVDDDFSFTSRTIPVGTTDEIDVMSIKLKVPIWLSAPAKVKRISRIEEIITNISQGEFDPETMTLLTGSQFARIIVSPDDACVSVDGAIITLLGAKTEPLLPDGSAPSWLKLFTQYGNLTPTISTLKLFIANDIEGAFVSGSLQYTATANQLLWTIDASTLPANTVPAVNAVIDPMRTFPGQGLPSVVDGQRYLLIEDVGNSMAWGTLSARANDIIQYSVSTGQWSVSFASQTVTAAQNVLNIFTNRQLHWNGIMWVISIDGIYQPGYWRLTL
jgi:hypothetical protein